MVGEDGEPCAKHFELDVSRDIQAGNRPGGSQERLRLEVFGAFGKIAMKAVDVYELVLGWRGGGDRGLGAP